MKSRSTRRFLRCGTRSLDKAQAENTCQQTTEEHQQSGPEREPLTANADNVQRPGGEQEQDSLQVPQVHGANWVAIFTGLLVAVGVLQSWTFIASERATVTVRDFAFEGTYPAPWKPFLVNFDIHNSGRTTAFITNANVTIDVLPQLDATPHYRPNKHVAVKGPLAAGEVMHSFASGDMPAEHEVFTLDEGTVKALTTGTIHLYIYGFIEYRDQFKIFSHVTGFCRVYNPRENPSTGLFDRCEEDAYQYGD